MPGSALKKPAAAAILKRPAGKTGMTVRKAGMTARQTGMSARKAGMTAREVGTTARQAGLVGRESAAQEKAGPSARLVVSANAYMMWRKAAGNGMTNKQAGASWKSMSDEEKLPWKTAFACGKIEKLEQQHGMQWRERSRARNNKWLGYLGEAKQDSLATGSDPDPETPPQTPLQTIHGYELKGDKEIPHSAVLGQGSYGVVYRARDIVTGASVVLKIVHHENRNEIEQEMEIYKVVNDTQPLPMEVHWRAERTKFERCVQQAGMTAFARMLAGDAAAPIPYLALTWQGSSVYDMMHKKVGTTTDYCAIASQSLFAVQYLHRRGILHGDLKPGNMLWRDSDALLSLVDFGFAHLLNHRFQTRPSAYLYTPGYRSPELYECGHEEIVALEARMLGWDVFAWGTIASELVAKQPLFRPVAQVRGATRRDWQEQCKSLVQNWSRDTSAGSMYRKMSVKTWLSKDPMFSILWSRAFAVDLADCLGWCLHPSLEQRHEYWRKLEWKACKVGI